MQRSEKLKPQKILVVDGSRVVRASLVRCVSKSHDVCEAHDGESAWQSVVLDTSIIAVISGLGVASEDGSDLVERIRTNRLARINGLPFYLLASDNLSDNERERAKRLGVTALIPKKAPAATLAELFAPPDTVGKETDIGTVGKETDVGRDSTVGFGDLRARLERLDSLGASIPAKVIPVVGPDHEAGQRPSDGRLKRCLEQHLKKEAESHPTASALIFGIDDYASLCERFGQRIADKVVDKFSRLLRGKIGAQESLLPLADGRIGIAGNIGREQCAIFARRVCKALSAATLSVGGKQIKATVSAGIAAMPQDGSGLSAEELFYLALSRLDAAMAAGGNRIVYAHDGGRNLRQGEFIARLATLLTTSSPEAEMPCKSWLRSICVACHDARPEGEPAPCEVDVPNGSAGTTS
ncbi:diguanylate cyclase domain-containing protein [Azonexus sp.]|jgi:GGDEF domain-containing protein|uniref:GGDEF domain-containing response regulator n=1 Tax=Azonexus sp. TaxID=1872668 RepID=UPI0028324ADC|nr:diguanylate cyclase [Azonexus sp.]MDR1995856.1 diguanylate cyclase [Azonexus sp.]